jgi:hypothetical protein
MLRLASGALMLALITAPAPLRAQTTAATSASVTDTDIQRLRQALADATAEVDRYRSGDTSNASRLTRELEDLRDEVSYLRVKLRKEGRVSRVEYFDLRDRIDDLRARAAATTTTANGPSTTTRRDRDRGYSDHEIPVGTEIDVRLVDGLSSERNQVEDRFVATTVVDLQLGERVVIPAGSELRGIVSGVEKAGRIDRKGSLTLAFDSITIDGREREIRGIVTDTIESEGVKGEVGKIGTAAGAGAIIGGILGGVKGAIAGILIGGGGIAAATPGKDVELDPGTILRVRLDQPPAF